jgi:outer membrane protein assembly factor BamA
MDFADPIGGDREVPFTELASLGGGRPLRGFLEGRMRDRSATALQLEYQYPIWVWLDGALHYSVGNVFGPWLEGFEVERLKSSFGMGLRSAGSRDHVFEVLVAFGTERFESGGEIESFRLVVGATSAF